MHARRKIVAAFVAVLMLVCLLPAGLLTTAAADLQITTYDQLTAFASRVDAGESFDGKTVELLNSLSLGGETTPWTPIGTASNPFKGTFDGGNHVVSELYINAATASNQGLFGYVSGATMKNLTVAGEVTAKDALGGIAGYASGTTFQNCLNRATITSRSGNTANAYAGGIVGQGASPANNFVGCANVGAVKGGNADGSILGGYYLAGIIGGMSYPAVLTDCYNTGAVTGATGVGGLVAFTNALTLTNCYNGGVITATTGYAGSLAARTGGTSTYTNSYGINGKNSYGDYAVGQSMVNPTGTSHVAAVTAANLSMAFVADGDAINGGLPILEWQLWTDFAPDVTISTYEQMVAFAKSVNDGNSYKDQYVKLDVNLSLGGAEYPWTPIGTSSAPFEGTFDGGNHVISDLYINNTATNQGLFGYINISATIKNLTVRGGVKGGSNTGAFAGTAAGGTLTNCLNEASVSGTSGAGGMIGYSSSALTTLTGCGNTGAIYASTGYIGGMVGWPFSGTLTMTDCYNTGAITGPTGLGGLLGVSRANVNATNCYNGGSVAAASGYSGALAGRHQAGVAAYANCYYITGTNTAAVYDDQNPTGTSSVAAVTPAGLGAAFVADTATINGGMPILLWQKDTDTTPPVLPAFKEANVQSALLAGYITKAINATKAKGGLTPSQTLLGSGAWMSGASSTGTDWMAMTMGRFGYVGTDGNYHYVYDDGTGYADYLQAMLDFMEQAYDENDGILHSAKATEWHRAVIAILAIGGDPLDFGVYQGNPINLIADGSYNNQNGPGRQGINGWIWGLITINSGNYTVPAGAKYTTEDFITQILRLQLTDGAKGATYGGWSLGGGTSDPDITGMVIQALAPYYNDDTAYTYTNAATGQTVTKTVRQAVDESLETMSLLQRPDGDFSSWGTVNLESTVQLLVALTAIGVDPVTDPRFVTATGKTLLDGVMKYNLTGGGFSHSFTADPANPSADPGQYNGMATDQGTYGLVSYWRYLNGMRSLYDMRPEWTDAERVPIEAAMQEIDALPAPTDAGYKAALKAALATFRVVDTSERQYVYNYHQLADAIAMVGGEAALDTDAPYITELLISTPPTKVRYTEGESFSTAGLVVKVKYNTGTETTTTDYTYSPMGALTTGDTKIFLVYGVLGAEIAIVVDELMPWQGQGTAAAPYLLENLTDLFALRDIVRKGTYDTTGIFFKLTNDINLANVPKWVPIGDITTPFKGRFDGDNHAVWNLNTGNFSNAGFFGTLGPVAVVENFGVGSGQIGDGIAASLGGIAGSSQGATIRNCWNGADVSGSLWVGGILGGQDEGTTNTVTTTIESCYNTGTITASSSGGGIVGQVGTNLANNGNGIIIANCYNTGSIAGTGSFSNGGIVGHIRNNKADAAISVSNCYNIGAIFGTNKGAIIGGTQTVAATVAVTNCGALAGCAPGDTTHDKPETAMKSAAYVTELGAAYQADATNLNGGYPILVWQIENKIELPVAPDVSIGTAQELAAFAAQVNAGQDFRYQLIVLTADIDLANYANWTPIGKSSAQFQGVFDGQGHVIQNLTTAVYYGGLFGVAGDYATLQNVGIASGRVGANNNSFCGGLVGWTNGADVINCWNAAEIFGNYTGGLIGTVRDGTSTVSGCVNYGRVTGDAIGGIIGHVGSVDSTLVTITDCYNAGDIINSGDHMNSVGGIVGRMQNNTGVNNHKIIRCYNVGTIGASTSSPESGGLVGMIGNTSAVQDCYYLQAAGITAFGNNTDTAQSAAKTAEFLQSADALTALGVRFKSDATGRLNQGYPLLDWQFTADLEAAAAVEALIAALTPVTLASADAIANARQAYDALTPLQKTLVMNDADLQSAEAELAALTLAAAKAAAKATLATYADPTVYAPAEQTLLAGILANGAGAIDAATNQADIDAALAAAKAQIDALPTLAQPVTLQDNGVRVEGNRATIPDGTTLRVQSMTPDAQMQGALAAYAKVLLLDISLIRNGQEVQPEGIIKIRLPIPADFDRTQLELLHFAQDGTATPVGFTIEGDDAVFLTDSLSPFALVQKAVATQPTQPGATPTPAPNQPGTTPTQNPEVPAPLTGDSNAALPLLVMALCALAVVAITQKRKAIR